MPEESLPLSVELRIDAVCQSFEGAWKAAHAGGTRPRIEDHLGAVPEPEQGVLLGELLKVELHYRRGERPTPEEYQQRFPQHGARIAGVFAQMAAAPGPPRQGGGGRETVRAAAAQETGQDPNRTALESPPPTPEGQEPAVAAPALPTIPGYEMLGVLGRGGMGVVYRARHVRLNRLVALKMILAGGHAGEEELARFRSEAELVARSQHPNIVQIYEIGDHAGLPYFSLEFVDGGSLHQKLAGAPQQPGAAAQLIETLARAVHAAHQRGVVHRDLKPANVLLTRDGVPKVTDFGLAKHLDEDSGRTQSGAVMGTPSYMAPEQAAGRTKEIGPPADVWALGAILYETLTGNPPFKGATVRDTLEQVCTREPVPVRQLQPKVPRDLETVCLKCLHKEPARRYRSAADLADDLRRFLDGRPVQARPVGSLEKSLKWARRRPAVAGLLAAVVLVTAVGFAGTYSQYRDAVKQKENAENESNQKGIALTRALDAEHKAGERAESEKQARVQETLAKQELGRQLNRARRLVMIGQTTLAQAVYKTDPAGARQRLEDVTSCPFDLRDFTWGFCHRLCTGKEVSRVLKEPAPPRGQAEEGPQEYEPGIHAIAFTPDGRTLVSVGTNGVRLWDVPTGRQKPVPRLETRDFAWPRSGSPLGAFNVAISPDGRTLATEGYLWDLTTGKARPIADGARPDEPRLETGRLVFTVRANMGSSRAFGPDGKLLAVGWGSSPVGPVGMEVDKPVQLFDVATGRNVMTLREYGGASPLVFAPDSLTLACIGFSGVRLWDVTTGRERTRFQVPELSKLNSVAFSPDGKTLAMSRSDGVRLIDLATGQERANFGAEAGGPMAFTPDGASLATGGEIGGKPVITLWDVATGQERLYLEGHTGPVTALAFAANGKVLASGSADKTVRLWDATVPSDWQVGTNRRSCGPVALSPDGTILAAGGGWPEDVEKDPRNPIRLWDLKTGQERAVLGGHVGRFLALTFSPDGTALISAGPNNRVKVWEVATGKQLSSVRGFPGAVSALALAPDGKTWASAAFEFDDATDASFGEIKVWDAGTGQERAAFSKQPTIFTCLIFSPDGKALASGGRDGKVRLWDVATGTERATRGGHPAPINCLAFSADGKTLASASIDYQPSKGPDDDEIRKPTGQQIKLWDVATGRESALVLEHNGGATSLAFSPDGQTLAAGEESFKVRIEQTIIPPGPDTVPGPRPAPGPGNAVGLESAGKVRLWDLATGKERSVLDGQWAPTSLSFTPDGKKLVFGAVDTSRGLQGYLKLWEVGPAEGVGSPRPVTPK